MKPRFPRAEAVAVAKELCDIFQKGNLTERLLVAGSLRRRKPEVGDVEILYIPRMETILDPGDMFGKTVEVNLVDILLEVLLQKGRLAKRPNKDGHFTWGDENKLAIHVASGIPVDFFSARPANWWNLSVCRTGSAESNERICNAAIARGWKWKPYGAGFEDRHTGAMVRRTQSERDVFEAVGLVYKEPWER